MNCRQHSGACPSARSFPLYSTKLPGQGISSGRYRRICTCSHQWSHGPSSGEFFSRVLPGTGSLPAVKGPSLMPFLPSQRMPLVKSPLRTADAGIDRQYNNRDICKFTSLQHLDQWGDVRQSRGPDPGSYKEFCSITLEIMDQLPSRLLGAGKIFPIRGPCDLHICRPVRDFPDCLLNEVD